MGEDKICIDGIHARGILGVDDWERKRRQDILIDLELVVDVAPVASSDDLDQAVNYRSVTKNVLKHVEEAERRTIEALADDIARIVLAFEGVERATVRVQKPDALRNARSVSVEITRDQ